MPCPLHHFASVGHCPYCRCFGGGFVEGFIFYPTRLYKGMFQFTPQYAKDAGRDLRTMSALARKYPPNQENRNRAQEAYSELPPPVQEGLQLGAVQSVGSVIGGMLASMLIAGAMGRCASRMAVITLGPRGTLHAPYWGRMASIFGGGLLSWYALMGSTVDHVNRRNQLVQQLPEQQRQIIDDIIRELLDEDYRWDDPGKGPASKQ